MRGFSGRTECGGAASNDFRAKARVVKRGGLFTERETQNGGPPRDRTLPAAGRTEVANAELSAGDYFGESSVITSTSISSPEVAFDFMTLMPGAIERALAWKNSRASSGVSTPSPFASASG